MSIDYHKIDLDELLNKTFGRLTIVNAYRNDKGYVRVKASCLCDGNIKDYSYYSLRKGHTLSCGCLRKENTAQMRTVHHGRGTRLYNIWKGMRQRCNNPNHPEYKYYGGAGIKICEKWNDFQIFREWALNNGYAENLTIERNELDGDYCPQNCKWIPKGEQSSNKRDTVLMEVNGVKKPFTVWCKEYHTDHKTVKKRMNKGLSFYEALSVPKGKHII